MIALSKEERDGWLEDRGVNLHDLKARQSQTYRLPTDAGSKNFLARYIAESMFHEPSEVVLEVTGWSVWPSSDNPELFAEYRASLNEHRPIIEAPFHIFSKEEQVSFRNLLNLCLLFFYDCRVLKLGTLDMFAASHDEVCFFNLTDQERQLYLQKWFEEK